MKLTRKTFLVTFLLVLTCTFGPWYPMSRAQAEDTATRVSAELDEPEQGQDHISEPHSHNEQSTRVKLQRLQYGYYSLFITGISVTLGILLFMVLVYLDKGWAKLKHFFGQGQLLQLVVILVIAGNVCSLAIMDILDTSAVSALYGGIVGYILGKRVPDKAG